MIDVIFTIVVAVLFASGGYIVGLKDGKTDFCKQYGGTYIQEKCVVEMKELEIKK